MYGIAAEPNRRKCRVWNRRGNANKLLVAIPDAEISAVLFFFAQCCGLNDDDDDERIYFNVA